jgi:DNA-binding CsgD family transcriptional regulator
MKEIAKKLSIGTSTVVTYIGRIYTKLEVKNAPSAVAKAFGFGILPLDEEDSQGS